MILAPEPLFWLGQFKEHGPVFAPWALPALNSSLLPRRVRGFLSRRTLADAVSVPGWVAFDGALRAWAGNRADRLLKVRFLLRRATDKLAARKIRRDKPAVVVAPSCGAEWSFAAAREVGARTILVEDLPDVRGLQRDLDRAASIHTSSAFLRRYRAPAWIAARQEIERLSADQIYVRGHFAWGQRITGGIDPMRLSRLESSAASTLVRAPEASEKRLLLAGLAAARNGSNEILALASAYPAATIFVRAGDGTEPQNLLAHPRIRPYDGGPIHGVLLPAWCESYAPEVEQAVRAGLPIIATRRGAGFADITEIEPGDTRGLVHAVEGLA